MSGADDHVSLEEADPYHLVSEYEDVILSVADLIDTSLEENLIKPDYVVKRPTIIRSVEAALRTETDSDESHALAHMLLSVIGSSFPDSNNELREAGASKEMVTFLTEMATKYGEESHMPNYYYYQGPNYWNSFDVDILKRGDSEAIGMNYRFIINHSHRQELSASLDSNLSLVYNLLMAQAQAIEEFGNEAVEQTSLELFYEVKEMLESLSENIEEVEEEADSSINEDR